MEIISGIRKAPQKLVIYGTEGVGKTLLTSKFDGVLFIDIEGSTQYLDVQRTPTPRTYEELLEQVDYIKNKRLNYRTIAIDTIDAVENLCFTYLQKKKKIESLGDIPHGNGHVIFRDEMARFMDKLDTLRDVGYNLIVIGHSQLKMISPPEEMGSYEKYELNLEKKVAKMVAGWADSLLFCHFKTMLVKQQDQKVKATGGRRTIQVSDRPSWSAKNRFGLVNEIDYQDKPELLANMLKDYFDMGTVQVQSKPQNQIQKPQAEEVIQKEVSEPIKKPTTQFTKLDELRTLMDMAGFGDSDIENYARSKKHLPTNLSFEKFPESYISKLIENFQSVKKTIEEMEK